MLHHFGKKYKTNWEHYGQLCPRERQFVQEAIWRAKPELVIEIGTRYGNGTTIEIAKSLKSLGRGHLHTCEIDHDSYLEALYFLDGREVSDFVTCHHVNAVKLISSMTKSSNIPDFWIFDGAEDPPLNLDLFRILEDSSPPGVFFCSHDWDKCDERFDGSWSMKCAKLRPYVETSKKWEIIDKLKGSKKVPGYGIVLARKIA